MIDAPPKVPFIASADPPGIWAWATRNSPGRKRLIESATSASNECRMVFRARSEPKNVFIVCSLPGSESVIGDRNRRYWSTTEEPRNGYKESEPVGKRLWLERF